VTTTLLASESISTLVKSELGGYMRMHSRVWYYNVCSSARSICYAMVPYLYGSGIVVGVGKSRLKG
jgi:hypothetical protein